MDKLIVLQIVVLAFTAYIAIRDVYRFRKTRRDWQHVYRLTRDLENIIPRDQDGAHWHINAIQKIAEHHIF
jgi:hypothetical protein